MGWISKVFTPVVSPQMPCKSSLPSFYLNIYYTATVFGELGGLVGMCLLGGIWRDAVWCGVITYYIDFFDRTYSFCIA